MVLFAFKGLGQSKLFAVPPGSEEYVKVSDKLRATIPTATIMQIARVENAKLHEAFHLKLNDIKDQMGGQYKYHLK